MNRDQFTRSQCTTGCAQMPQRAPEPDDNDEEAMVTLLLVDESLVRRGLRMWLDRAGTRVSSGVKFLRLMQKHWIGSRAIAHSRGREETVRPQVSWRSSAAMK